MLRSHLYPQSFNGYNGFQSKSIRSTKRFDFIKNHAAYA